MNTKLKDYQIIEQIKFKMTQEMSKEGKQMYQDLLNQIQKLKESDVNSYINTLEDGLGNLQGEIDAITNARLIEINSQNNKMKELNDYNFKDINSEEMKQQINELKDNNNQLIRKLKDVNDGNYELEQKNNVLENEMGKLKGYEQMLEQLKEKYDNLSFDYQRIQRENSSLKNLINNNQ